MAPDRRRIALLLVLVAGYRLSLLGRGAVAFIDETLYFKAALALGALASADFRMAVFHLVTNNARPGDAVLKVVPSALQAIPLAFGVPVSHPVSLLIPTFCNVAVSLVAVWLVYRLCESFTEGDELAALAATTSYALLVNSNVYIRHLFPYDWALTLALWAIWLSFSRRMSEPLALVAGFMGGAVVLIYPGYYPLVALIGMAVVGAETSSFRRRGVRAALVGLSAAIPILVAELLGRWAGFGYLSSARELSATITGGAFEEGWMFLPRYLFRVERAAGIILLAGIAAYAIAAIVDIRGKRRVAAIHWIMAAAAGGWVWQALLSSVVRTMVLYGRLIHPWMATLAFALAFAIHALPSSRAKAGACAIVLTASIASWATSARDYYRLAYPRDVLYGLSIDTNRVPADRRICEFEPTQRYQSPPPIRGGGAASRESASLVLVNMCQGYPVEDRTAQLPSGARVLFDGPHFERYTAYGFEGYTPDQRLAFRARDYRVRVYELAAARLGIELR